MKNGNRIPPPGGLWSYRYDFTLPVGTGRLGVIGSLLDGELSKMHPTDRIWSGRMVVEDLVTGILVVSDDPARDRVVNRKLETELDRLGATFKVTVPVEVKPLG